MAQTDTERMVEKARLLPIRTRREAWVEVAGQRNIPIDGDFDLRRQWFRDRNQVTFSTFLIDRFPPDKPWKMLTIGVFEGAQEIWLLQNVLCHPASRLFCIDPWVATSKLNQDYMNQCRINALNNLKDWQGKVNIQRGFSQELMTSAVKDGGYFGEALGSFDLVIIDGNHDKDPVYEDAVNAYAFAKPGGWLLFDDVRNLSAKVDHVKEGLEKFLPEYADRVRFSWAHRFCDCYEKL